MKVVLDCGRGAAGGVCRELAVLSLVILVEAVTMAAEFRSPSPEGVFPCPDKHFIGKLFFTPDGKQLTGTGVDLETKRGVIHFWEVGTRKLVCTRTTGQQVSAAAFAHDGKRFVTADWDNKVHVFAAPDWHVEELLDYHLPNQIPLSLAVLPDGARLLTPGVRNRGVRIWDLKKRQTSVLAPEGKDLVRAFAFSKNTKRFAVAYTGPLTEVWDTDELRVIGRLELERDATHRGVFTSVAFSPDGKTIATGYLFKWNLPIAIWDGTTFKRLHDCHGFSEHAHAPEALAFSADNKFLVACSGPDIDKPAEILVWEVATGKLVYKFHPAKDGGGMQIALSPDGRWLVHSAGYCTIRLWDFEKIRREMGK